MITTNVNKKNNFLKNHFKEIISIILSFVIISIWFNLKVALFIFVILFVHEGGHVWAMIKTKVGINKIYFFILGGCVSSTREAESYSEHINIAIMGSVFTLALMITMFIAWIILDIDLIADMIILISTMTILNLMPRTFLDGNSIKESIQKSKDINEIFFLIPEWIILYFLVFKTYIIIALIIIFVFDKWISSIKKKGDYEQNILIALTKKEIQTYYIGYIAIILICIIFSLFLESKGFDLILFYNFDNVINGLN